MIKEHYNKKKAREICRRLEGLSFSCRPTMIKRTIFFLGEARYIIKTNAPEIIIKDVSQEVYY